jgi:SpoVK/Ycf46/Vps4 family AAA+-type ATPase
MKKNILFIFNFIILTNYHRSPYDSFVRGIEDGIQVLTILGVVASGTVIFKGLSDLIFKKNNKNDIKFSDIGGYKKIKEELLAIVQEAKNPNNTNTNMNCILLYGPPGTGKTYLAQALGNETRLNFINLDATDIISSPYLGEAEAGLKHILTQAKLRAPSIIFMDEAEVFFSDTIGNTPTAKVENNIKNLFLTHMDGSYNMKGVILIACTNRIEDISPAFLRSGRIEHKIFMGLPSYEDRLAIIKINLKKYQIILEDAINIKKMAQATNNFNAADLNTLFKKIKQLLKKNKKQSLNEEIFISQLSNIKLNKLAALNKTTTPKKIYFSDIGGYRKTKEELLAIVEDSKTNEPQNTNMSCILLQGPPGTGKTHLAQALANESNLPIIILDSTDILSSPYIGQSEKQLKNILEKTKENKPCILFIDEIDTMLSHRNQNHNSKNEDNIKNLLLSYMDGIHEMNGAILIGTTNNVSNIDSAFLRAGRFDIINIDLPSYQDRLEIIEIIIKKKKLSLHSNITLNYLAERTANFTAADLNKLFSIVETINKKNHFNTTSIDTFIEAYLECTLGAKNTQIILNKDEKKNTAVHEAGHALLQFILSKQKALNILFDFVTISPRGNTLGTSHSKMSMEYRSLKKEHAKNNISILLAGRTAQEILLNQIDAGASNDLEQATIIAQNMIKKLGFGKKISNMQDKNELIKETNEIIETEYKKVTAFFKKHKSLLLIISNALLEKEILYKKDIEEIINAYQINKNIKLIY